MKRVVFFIILLLSVILIFPGCAGSKGKGDVIQVGVLQGPSAIALAAWIEHPPVLDGRRLEVKVYDSPSQIQAAIIKGEAEIAALPMINAVNLYNKGMPVVLAGCPLWGTLYIVGKEPVFTLHLFGAGTTPDILARHYLTQHQKEYQLNYSLNTAAEVAQALLLGKVQAAVLSEPFVNWVLQRDPSLHIIANLNTPVDGELGFTQTAVVFHPDLLPYRGQLDSLLQSTCEQVTKQPESTIRLLEEGIFTPGMLSEESLQRLKIHYLPATDIEQEVYSFLEIISEYEPKAIGGQLPNRGFITGRP